MNNIKILFLFFLSLSANVLTAQNEIRARIVGEDGFPIPMAHVRWQNQEQGTVSNESGDFILSSRKIEEDSIFISAIGFKTRQLSVKNISSEIVLNEEVYMLKEIAVRPGGYREVELGFVAESIFEDSILQGAHNYQMEDFQLLKFIDNPSDEPVELLSVSFYIGDRGKHQTPFKIRLYSIDEEEDMPDKDLLSAPLIVQSDVKDGWFETDLKGHNLFLPPEGAFVAMQWFYSKKFKKYLYKEEFEFTIRDLTLPSVRHLYGQSLGSYRLAKANKTWSKCCNKTAKFRSYKNSYYTPMIKVKALLYDNGFQN